MTFFGHHAATIDPRNRSREVGTWRQKEHRRHGIPGARGTISLRVADPAFEVADGSIGPGFTATPHVHRVHHEIFLVVEGQIEFLVGDETMRVHAGGFVVVPPGAVHDFHNPGQDAARLVCLGTPGGLYTQHDTESVHVVWRIPPEKP